MRKLSDYFNQPGALSKQALADELGVTLRYIHMLEKEERRPSPEIARKLESITGIPLEALLFPGEAVA